MVAAELYLERFHQAKSLAERQQVAEQYKQFYHQLTPDEQKQADSVMNVLWPNIHQKVDELEQLMSKAEAMLQGQLSYQ